MPLLKAQFPALDHENPGAAKGMRSVWVGSAIAQPANQFGQRSPFPVHQDPNPVQFRRDRQNCPDADDQKPDGERKLPHGRYLRRHAQEHDDGRGWRE